MYVHVAASLKYRRALVYEVYLLSS